MMYIDPKRSRPAGATARRHLKSRENETNILYTDYGYVEGGIEYAATDEAHKDGHNE